MMQARPPIGRLFNARSIAVVGGTAEPAKLGSWPFVALRNRGYRGRVHAVNPKYTELFGWPCVPSIADLPDDVEAAIIMLPAAPAVEAAEACAQRGIRALVIGAQGIGETGAEGKALERRLAAICAEHNVALCGPNANGLANLSIGLTLSFSPILQRTEPMPKGAVTVISQSGAMIGTLLGRLLARDIGIRSLVTCGNQLVLALEDYLDHFAADEGTHVIVLFVEQITRGAAMRAALRRCREAGKHVVALKVGQSEAATRAAASHTGAIAGVYANSLALLRAESVAVVEDLETLAACAQLLTQHPWPRPDPKPFVVSISGGLAALLSDMMARHGIAVPEITAEAAGRLGALSDLSHPINPYDLAGRYGAEFVSAVIEAFRADGFDQLVCGLGLLPDPVLQPLLDALIAARRGGLEHLYAYWSSSAPADRARLREAGISVTEDAESLFRAMRILARSTAPPPPARSPEAPRAVAALDGAPGLLDEAASKAALTALGLASPGAVVLAPGDALAKTAGLAFPWVMKGLSDRIAHKSEHGLVALGIRSAAEAEEVRARLAAALHRADPTADRLLVEETANGTETFLGFERDPTLGPVVVVGAGGVLVELLREVVTLAPPFDEETVRAGLRETRFGRLLAGWRGRSFDLDALARAAVLVGDLSLTVPRLRSLDINPLFVREGRGGVVVGDAKIVLGDPA